MRIAIVTHPLLNNYGGILQNYALQQVLREMGNEVYTIDRNHSVSFKTKILSLGKRSLLRLTGKKVKLRGWQTKREENIINSNTRTFIGNYIQITVKVSNVQDVKKLHEKFHFDAYIVGSDQVWRRSESRGNNMEFLSFLRDNHTVKKIAYSASFGVDRWEFTKAETQKYRTLAQSFDAISVREDTGIELCKKYLHVDAIQLVDPTMLISVEKYISLIKASDTNKSQGDLFVYVLDRNKEKEGIIEWVKNEKRLKPFEVMPEQNYRMELSGFDINKCVFPGIETWLRAFMDARFVITDSFHGTVFSILFNKPFAVILNKKRGAARFQSLLKKIGLESRIISDKNQIDSNILSGNIDWKQVNEVLEKERIKAGMFIKEALHGQS